MGEDKKDAMGETRLEKSTPTEAARDFLRRFQDSYVYGGLLLVLGVAGGTALGTGMRMGDLPTIAVGGALVGLDIFLGTRT